MSFSIILKWKSKSFTINDLTGDTTLKELQSLIEHQTKVKPSKQKLLSLKTKGSVENVSLKELRVKPNMKVMMVGTTDDELKEVLEPPPVTEVINDFEDDDQEEVKLEHKEENLAKIAKRVSEYKIEEFNPPRKGKKLLVLDIDYTLFDHRSTAEKAIDLMRPYLHDFLTQAYEDYDIGIWSATSMKWITVKMKELGVSDNPNYKICFFMDHGAMITVFTERYGVVDIKPLGVIWGKYPDYYSSENTIMVDDLRRNFLMNPKSGLRISPYRNSYVAHEHDKELKDLASYLKKISTLESFAKLDHHHWKNFKKSDFSESEKKRKEKKK